MSDLLDAVSEVARLAGQTALRYYRKQPDVERKADGSPVTIADREAERVAREWITARFPKDGILGEEQGESPGTSGRRWLLDPVDGTKSFVAGVPLWGSLVAVMEGDTVIAGAADFPPVDERIAAAPGEGCWHNGSRCRVSSVANLGDAVVLSSSLKNVFRNPVHERGWPAVISAGRVNRTWGDAFGYLLVATGRAEVMADARLNPWDIACFGPIIREAGGVITDLDGLVQPTPPNAVATNAALAEEVRRILNGGAA